MNGIHIHSSMNEHIKHIRATFGDLHIHAHTYAHIPAMCKFTMSNRVSVIAHVLSLQMCVDLGVL